MPTLAPSFLSAAASWMHGSTGVRRLAKYKVGPRGQELRSSVAGAPWVDAARVANGLFVVAVGQLVAGAEVVVLPRQRGRSPKKWRPARSSALRESRCPSRSRRPRARFPAPNRDRGCRERDFQPPIAIAAAAGAISGPQSRSRLPRARFPAPNRDRGGCGRDFRPPIAIAAAAGAIRGLRRVHGPRSTSSIRRCSAIIPIVPCVDYCRHSHASRPSVFRATRPRRSTATAVLSRK